MVVASVPVTVDMPVPVNVTVATTVVVLAVFVADVVVTVEQSSVAMYVSKPTELTKSICEN